MYICLKCTQFLKINADNSLSVNRQYIHSVLEYTSPAWAPTLQQLITTPYKPYRTMLNESSLAAHKVHKQTSYIKKYRYLHLRCFHMKILSNKSCYSIGLLSCESTIFFPYKEVSHFKTFYWSRHVSVASSLKGGGRIHCSAHCTLYSWSLFHVVQNHSPAVQLTCCRLADLRSFWASLTLRNIKVIIVTSTIGTSLLLCPTS